MSFILSKLAWPFLAPANVFALLLLATGFLSISRSETRRTWGRWGVFTLAFLLFLIAIFPVGDWLLAPLENRFATEKPAHVDGIILLAGDEDPYLSEMRAPPVLGSTAQRYITFATLARTYPEAKLVFVGGTNTLWVDKRLSNAAVAKETLIGLGVDPTRMTYEDLSRNTFENASFSFKEIKPSPDQAWLLVTSAFHMPRAIGCFRKAGWNVYAAPTDYRTPAATPFRADFDLLRHLRNVTMALHEYVGLVIYHAMGRIKNIWPKAHAV